MIEPLPQLRGPRVVLREPREDDAEPLFEAMSDVEVRRWLLFATRISGVADMHGFLERCSEYRQQNKWIMFVVEPIDVPRAVGMTWFAQIVPATRAEMGTWLARGVWATGLYQEVKNLIVPFGFTHLGLRRIEGRIAVSNVRMQRAFERIGAVREGVIRQGFVSDNCVEDQYLYSLLPSEYRPPTRSCEKPTVALA
jgi:RimJ/RimL family protein N-acetyltransferase